MMGAVAKLREEVRQLRESLIGRDAEVRSLKDEIAGLRSEVFRASSADDALRQIAKTLEEKGLEELRGMLRQSTVSNLEGKLPELLRGALDKQSVAEWLSSLDLRDLAEEVAGPMINALLKDEGLKGEFTRALADLFYEDLDLDTIAGDVTENLANRLEVQVSLAKE